MTIAVVMPSWAQSPALPDTLPDPPVQPLFVPERYNTIYAFPEQNTNLSFSHPDWHRLWVNTAVLSGAFVTTLFTLELLPENATNWNRAEYYHVPLFKRWKKYVITKGPEWDHDNTMFNFLLHPYSGAAYFMGARSCGFSFWGSLLYSTCISTIEWEFGIEAFMERPSYQDIFITPLVGSVMGEGFFRIKRYLVANNYRLFGSPVLGNIVAFLVDPVNEVIGLVGGNPARKYAKARQLEVTTSPVISPGHYGLTLNVKF